ncbi:PAS domain-containing sensor histidine kinase [Denitromonas sp.]|uniref:PAS domain-containing sensor histidine kinase n=1 Tax=Denitromonas sp. TaxID=2734609 RepID=UPI003A86E42C
MQQSAAEVPFQWIVEQSLAGIYVIQDEVFAYVNPTFLRMLGKTEAAVVGHGIEAIAAPDEARKILDNVRRRIDGEIDQLRYVVALTHEDGRGVFMEVDAARMTYRGRPAVVGIGLDVTEQVRRSRELERSRAELVELTAYINTVREVQRAKFSRELHDELGGMLGSLKMDITRLRRRTELPEARAIIDDMAVVTREAIATVRRISDDLRPGVLDHLGLLEAIRGKLLTFQKRHDIACVLEPDELPVELPQEQATAIYRIFQAALTNVGEHAGATGVSVSLSYQDGMLSLSIEDNGVGIDATTPRCGAMGLLGMSERAREMGGELTVEPVSPRGTRVALRVPVASA